MGINALSWKRIRALNRRLGERFVHVYTYSHHEHWMWVALRHDGSAVDVDTRTWTTAPAELQASESSAVHLLTTREPKTEAHADFLRLVDERYAEVRYPNRGQEQR